MQVSPTRISSPHSISKTRLASSLRQISADTVGTVLGTYFLPILMTFAVATSASAADKHFVNSSNQNWGNAPNGGFDGPVPNVGDRAIYDKANTGMSYFLTPATRSIDQLVFLAPYTGSGFVNNPLNPAAEGILSIGGYNGIGIDNQVNQQITLNRRVSIAGNQEWQISSANGSIKQLTAGANSGVALGIYTLILNPVNAANFFTFDNPISGTGGVTVIGAGRVNLNTVNTYVGATTINSGTLSLGAAGSIATSSMVTVNHGGRLEGTGISGNTTNFAGGTIAPGNSIGTLFIAGNYIGNSGTLEIEGQFAGTGSPADRLLISGNASGTTIVKTINLGGTGAITGSGNTDGISIVQVAGTGAANTFQLAGGYAAAGPYQYQLRMFDAASSAAGEVDPRLGAVPFYDYRLQSLVDASGKPIAVPQIAGYQALPTGAVRYGASLLDSVHKRLGELRQLATTSSNNGVRQNDEFYMRVQGATHDVSGNRASGYDQNIWYVQAGGNILGKDMADGAKLRIGGAISYGDSNLKADRSSARVNLRGTTVALTTTYQAANGWYLDGVTQLTKYTSDIRTNERGQVANPNGLGFGISLEGGYPFDLGGGLVVEPQAQLSYQKIKFDTFLDTDRISVDLQDGKSLRGRLGGRMLKTYDINTNRKWSPFVEANLLHEFLRNGNIRAGGVQFGSDSLGTSAQIGGGVNAQVGVNKIAFASVSYEKGLSSAAADAWSGNVGMRIDF
ncbi:putative autotransporter precursor [compost metagenome]